MSLPLLRYTRTFQVDRALQLVVVSIQRELLSCLRYPNHCDWCGTRLLEVLCNIEVCFDLLETSEHEFLEQHVSNASHYLFLEVNFLQGMCLPRLWPPLVVYLKVLNCLGSALSTVSLGLLAVCFGKL
jgi:hypothetical protein